MAHTPELVEFTNMCMVYDDRGNILVQDRKNPDWPGVTFPGGHVEPGESFVEAVIREVKEETGLDISSPRICGVKQWPKDEKTRYVVLFYKTNRFSGCLRDSDEGRVFWVPADHLREYPLASDMEEMYRIFSQEAPQEFQWLMDDRGAWHKRIL